MKRTTLRLLSGVFSALFLGLISLAEAPVAFGGQGQQKDYVDHSRSLTTAQSVSGCSLIDIVFTEVLPNSVFRTFAAPAGGAEAAIFLQDCCIRDDVVEVYIDGCFVARVDSRGGEVGTHPGETHIISVGEGVHTLEYRDVVSKVGPSGWVICDTPALSPFTGQHPCGVKEVALVCRPLDGNCIRSSAGRHCYFLVTLRDGTKVSYGAYDVSGQLQPGKNGDPLKPPGGCGSGVSGSDCINVPAPPGGTLNNVLSGLESALMAGAEGTYNRVTNNSNLWAKRRINGLGLTVTLPATAITNQNELCAQLPTIKQNLRNCGLTNVSIAILIALFGSDLGSCP